MGMISFDPADEKAAIEKQAKRQALAAKRKRERDAEFVARKQSQAATPTEGPLVETAPNVRVPEAVALVAACESAEELEALAQVDARKGVQNAIQERLAGLSENG